MFAVAPSLSVCDRAAFLEVEAQWEKIVPELNDVSGACQLPYCWFF
jgi:hypothetical protein